MPKPQQCSRWNGNGGTPQQNGLNESSGGQFRDQSLNKHLLSRLAAAQLIIKQ